MKRVVLLLSLLLLMACALAAETIKVGTGDNSISVLSSSATETVLKYQITTFEKTRIDINGKEWYQIRLPHEGVSQDKGFPELPVFNRSIIIDNSALMKLEVYDVQYQDFILPVSPSKGVISRNIDPDTVPYTFDKVYQSKEFYPGKVAELSDPYIMRDFRGITVKTVPFAYNPETRTLRVFTSYRIRVFADGMDRVNTLSTAPSSISRDFAPLYENHFINWQNYRYTPVNDAYGKLIVICHTNYMSTILPYVNWKKQKGIQTELVEWSTIGTTAAQLQTYIQTRYTADPTIAYIQLVGDAPQIPSLSSGGGGSDPTFSLVAGGDQYPDIFIGRFSAETTGDVTAQINKAIVYERDLTTSATWLTRATGIASAEGGGSQGDNGESDIVHMNGIRTDLLGYGYTTVDQVYDPGALASTITTNVNAGRGFINYVGHGADTYWVTTSFNNTNASALTNGNMTPFIMDVACVNGNFVSMTCFAEAWLRNANGGAVAMYASTINQSWNSPMLAEDECTDLLVAGSKTTAGGLYYNSSCKMMDTYGNTSGSDGVNMFKTWHIFGDASLLVRSKTPLAMSVTHPSTIIIGTTSLNVSTGVANTLVSVTYNNTIYGRGFTNSSGNATITLTSPPSGVLNYTITATAFNRVTYIGTIQQIAGSGPFVNVSASTYADSNNNTAEYNESGRFNVTYQNVGSAVATNVVATLTCATSGITITDNTETIASLAAGASTTVNNAYAFSMANNIVNGTSAAFTITMVSGADTWTYNFNLTINAPALALGSMTISDPSPGNANGRLDPGETVTITMPLSNTGAAASPTGSATLTSPTSGITVNTGTSNFTAIAASGSSNLSFSITASSSMSIGTVASLVFNATAGAYTASKTETTAVGLITETFETGNFASFPWIQGTTPWVINTTSPHAGTYSAKSGTILASGSTTMETTRILTASGTLTFWYKVSSEASYDYLKFYIDGTLQTQWAGELAWTQASYTLAAGTRVLKWEYMKDSSVDSGSDCAWIDDIIFPASTAPSSFYPPQNFVAAPGNAVVNLTWTAPVLGTPTSYKIFRNSTLLTSVTGLSYSDTAVTNETSYSYYLKAVYSGGESDPTTTLTVMPTAIVPTSVIIGTGTTATATTAGCPINVYYQSLHGQSVYLASELAAAGVSGPINITQIGFNVAGLPSLTMPNYVIRMGHTTSTNVASWISTGLTQVWSSATYLPTATGWNMLTLSTPFLWNGTDNIVVDTGYGLIGSYTSTGTVLSSTVTNGYRFVRSDTVDETNVWTAGSTATTRPNVKLTLLPNQTGPNIGVSPTSVSSTVYVGETASPTLTITNTGTTALNWSTGATISTWGTVAPTSGSIAAGGNTVLTLTLNSAGLAANTYTSNMVITSNANNTPSLTVPVSFTVQPSPYPANPRFVSEWEPAKGAIVRYPLGLPYTVLAAMSNNGLLYVVVASASQTACNTALSSNGVNMTNVRYINATTDTYWVRDYGPWTIFDGGEMKIVDFTYNRPRPNDDIIPVTVANYIGVDYYTMPLTATGGNVMSDSHEAMMTTDLILEENPTLTETQIDAMLEDYLGVTDYQHYADPNNTYIDHIDCWGKLLDVDKVLIRSVPTSHAQYSAIEATVDDWESRLSGYGTPYQIFRVYTPNDEPYSNSYIMNKSIYVPMMGTANDAAAIASYQAAMPGYSITGYTHTTWESTDALHCRVNTVFDDQMIHAWHVPPTSAQANSTIAMNVELTHANALVAATTKIAYRYATTGTWQSVLLTNVSGNNWTANVPTPALGQTLYYYILATDTTARTVTMPLCGASDPFELLINIPANNVAPTIVLPDSFTFDQDTNIVVDFSTLVNDADNDPLTLSYSGNTNVLVQIDGLNVTISSVAGWAGTENLTFTVSDGEFTANDTADVIVNLVYLVPPETTVVEMDPTTSTITWAPVPNAVTYEIWGCDDPYGEYTFLIRTATLQWQENYTGQLRRFYKIIASDQPITEK